MDTYFFLPLKWQVFFYYVIANKYYVLTKYRHKPNSKHTQNINWIQEMFFPFGERETHTSMKLILLFSVITRQFYPLPVNF